MRRLLARCYEAQLEWARAYARAGAHAFVISESYISPDIAHPSIYRGYLAGVHREFGPLAGEHQHVPPKAGGVQQGPEDVFSLAWTSAGGLGDPLERDPAAVLRDIEDGNVSAAWAHARHGVCLDEHGTIDAAATAARREALRRERAAGPVRYSSAPSWRQRSTRRAVRPSTSGYSIDQLRGVAIPSTPAMVSMKRRLAPETEAPRQDAAMPQEPLAELRIAAPAAV
mgnify:CR=1 FL=1